MLVYRNFRDIPAPLRVTKTATREKQAALFAAFPVGEELCFSVAIDRAFLTERALLSFRSDDDGRTIELPLLPAKSADLAKDHFTATLSLSALCGDAEDGLFYYHVIADTVYGRLYSHGSDGREDAWFSDDAAFASAYQLLVHRQDYDTPAFLRRGIMYQIFVDRFYRGGDAPPREDVVMAESWGAEITQYPAYPGAPLKNNLFYGGDLDGVRKKLPYLASLGVTVLYLCPIFEAYSNHKYDTGDYMRVDPMFGGRVALDRLLCEAKKQGISVLLDGVFNHTGAISRYFNKDGRYDSLGAYQSPESPYYPWYRFRSYPDDYECWWGVTILPAVRSDHPDYIRFISGEGGVADTYLQAGISGFRLDVADELHPSFLRALRRRVKKNDPQAALIGEVWEDASNKIAYSDRRRYFRGEELDSVMNYPLKNAIISYLLENRAEAFAETTATLYAHYPRAVSEALMNLLGTHDTERILTVLGGRNLFGLSYEEMKALRLTPEERALAVKRLFLAYAILYFMPGIPCIYYGDEAGMEGGKDPFNRRTYPWGYEDAEILSFFRRMAAFRREEEALLSRGYYRPLRAEGALLSLSRFIQEGEELLLLLNADRAATRAFSLKASYTDCLDGLVFAEKVDLPPLSFRILKRSVALS